MTKGGYRKAKSSQPLSDAFFKQEVGDFITDVLPAKHSLDITCIVLASSDRDSYMRWTAFLVRETNQLFIKVPSHLPLSSENLVHMLDMAEELGVTEVFACVVANTSVSDGLCAELFALDFNMVSPRGGKSNLIFLRFDF